MGARFDPGAGWGFVGEALVALVTADAPDELIAQFDVFAAASDVPAQNLIEALSTVGVGALPSLAVVLRAANGYHLFVRGTGRLGVDIDGAGNFEWLAAPDAASWSEVVRVAVKRFSVAISPDARPHADHSRYWCECGVVGAVGATFDASHFKLESSFNGAAGSNLAPSAAPVAAPNPPVPPVPPAPRASGDDRRPQGDLSPDAEQRKAYLRRLIEETRLRVSDAEPPVADPAVVEAETVSPPAADVVDVDDASVTHTLDFDDLEALRSPDVVSEASSGPASPDHNGTPPPPPVQASGLISAVPGERAVAPPSDSRPARDLLDPQGDHDGHTVTVETLRAARDAAHAGGSGATVQAVHCPSIHPNPPHAERCRTCGVLIGDHTVTRITRPTLGELRFDNGDAYPLDRPMLIGRRPSSARDTSVNGEPARLVTVQDPQSVLSKVHLEVRIEDWQVLVVDRNSTNHTIVVLPDRKPTQLHPGDAVQIVPGTRIELGGAARATYELKV